MKAFTDTHSNNFKGRGRGRGRGRGDSGNRDDSRYFKTNNDQPHDNGRVGVFDKSKVECFRYHKYSHYASECSSRLPHGKDKQESLNSATEKKVETLLMVVQDGQKYEANIWFMDTSCSNHMSGSKPSFSHLNEDFHFTVHFGDHSSVKVMGKCDIKIRTKLKERHKERRNFFIALMV